MKDDQIFISPFQVGTEGLQTKLTSSLLSRRGGKFHHDGFVQSGRRSVPKTESPHRKILEMWHFFHDVRRFFDELSNPLNKMVVLGVGNPGITLFHDGVVISAPSLEWKNLLLKRMGDSFSAPWREFDRTGQMLGGAGREKRSAAV
jgi:hypothetical protein